MPAIVSPLSRSAHFSFRPFGCAHIFFSARALRRFVFCQKRLWWYTVVVIRFFRAGTHPTSPPPEASTIKWCQPDNTSFHAGTPPSHINNIVSSQLLPRQRNHGRRYVQRTAIVCLVLHVLSVHKQLTDRPLAKQPFKISPSSDLSPTNERIHI